MPRLLPACAHLLPRLCLLPRRSEWKSLENSMWVWLGVSMSPPPDRDWGSFQGVCCGLQPCSPHLTCEKPQRTLPQTTTDQRTRHFVLATMHCFVPVMSRSLREGRAVSLGKDSRGSCCWGGGGSWQKPQQPQEAENIRINGKATSKPRHPPGCVAQA